MAGSLARSVIPQPLSLATYNASNQQVSFGNQTLTYDLNGNLLSDGANSYIWNARNRLLSMTGPGVDASFQYDAAGRRINKTVNGITTSFLHRFYRADSARSRAEDDSASLTSGAGLGLSIARWIAEVHDGTLELIHSSETGSVFQLVLPAR